ncbi:MAG: SPOR domain-containing protein, partial [Schleiferiaceae bacterium]
PSPVTRAASEAEPAPAPAKAAPAPKKPLKADKPAVAVAEASNAPYALVVGAFEDAENASRLAERLREAGYPAKVLKSNVGLKKVALRTFADANSARQAKAELKSDFPAIWIYHE